jgi:DNA-binding Lrp family transcriptional regulator
VTRTLETKDLRIVGLLVRDGRASCAEIARALGTSRRSVHHRIERLRREGVIHIGAIVNPEAVGYPVMGDAGPIAFQPTDNHVSIGRDGTVSVREGASKTDSLRGKLKMVTIDNQSQLVPNRVHAYDATWNENNNFPKLASSAAHLFGKPKVWPAPGETAEQAFIRVYGEPQQA